MNILILLIGSNPLPNYIVGSYLTKNGRAEADVLPEPTAIILVYSKDTEKFAKRIIHLLNVKQPLEVNLSDKEREPSVIVKGIQDKLNELAESDEIKSIHLNYTGGTKPMSLYAHIAVSEWVEREKKKDKIRMILSDIDPKNHKIVLRDKPDYPLSGDLRDHVKIQTDKILDLHYMQTITPGSQTLTIPEDKLMAFACQAIKKYRSNQKDLFQIFKDIKIRGRSIQDKERSINQSDFDAKFNQITTEFASLTCFDFTRGKLPFIEFFNGKWLEDVIFLCLKKLKDSSVISIDEINKGIEAAYGNRKTEIDVLAIQGYKLFLFSCTTNQEVKFVKQKAFEAIYRAEQLGGEHAKAVVVSLMYSNYNRNNRFTEDNNLSELNKDLTQFDAARNCRLIGIDDIQGECDGKNTLTNRLKNIILGVE